jgi:Arc/MetJ family transcription regulator
MCGVLCRNLEVKMPTNLAIDPELLQKALEVSGLKTKKETVNLALKELINRRKQLEILELFGKMDPDPDYDYKKGRFR